MLLDEVDKLGRDAARGDPAAALLEVSAVEQSASWLAGQGRGIDVAALLREHRGARSLAVICSGAPSIAVALRYGLALFGGTYTYHSLRPLHTCHQPCLHWLRLCLPTSPQVLDPEQNTSFVDTYLGLPFDLSSCLFVATANRGADIPAALLDRLEVVQLGGYTREEKVGW